MTQVIITGARGFVGKHLAKHCSEIKGSRIIGLGHGTFTPGEMERWGLTASINGDVSFANLDRISAEFSEPSIIFHLAGGSSVGPSIRSPEEDFQRTVVSTSTLLDWVRLRHPSCKVVYTSSAAVYGSQHRGAIAETSAINPFSPYGFHKRMAELLCESYQNNFGISCSVVRLFSVYGIELRKQLLWDFCQKLSKGVSPVTLHGTGLETRDWFNIRDCVRILAGIGYGTLPSAPTCLNGGTGIGTCVKDIVEHVLACWGEDRELHFNGIVPPGDPKSLIADVQLAKKTGFEPLVDWREGIKEYVSWFKGTEI